MSGKPPNMRKSHFIVFACYSQETPEGVTCGGPGRRTSLYTVKVLSDKVVQPQALMA